MELQIIIIFDTKNWTPVSRFRYDVKDALLPNTLQNIPVQIIIFLYIYEVVFPAGMQRCS